jgi:phosphopentomutase
MLDKYGDASANTLGHVLGRKPNLRLPNLRALGLAMVLPVATVAGRGQRPRLQASFGRMRELSAGKDTTTGVDGLIFANLVDFDMLFGHRRDVTGYAGALEEFDQWLGNFLPRVQADDLVIITADHGNDPTFRGTDHTREEVPLFVLYREQSRDLGRRQTFADVAATLAEFFGLERWIAGTSFLDQHS